MEEIQKAVEQVVKASFGVETEVVLTRPDPQFGDFATNIALQLAKQLGKSPRDIAGVVQENLLEQLSDIISAVSIAGPGFINIRLSDNYLLEHMNQPIQQSLAGKVVVAEYSDPNPFKILHAGHLYTSVVGDAIANLLESAGAEVHRVNYGGDVGLHVGKTMWSILQEFGGEHAEKLAAIDKNKRSEWLTKHYIDGTNAYEDDEKAKAEIIELNKRIYQLQPNNDHESPFAQIYWTTRKWSYDYFDNFYARIGTKFERYYPESTVAELGVETVLAHVDDGIYEKSDGAIVFKGEPFGLHTRVFINKQGLPTYEAKDIGLIQHKKADYNFDISVVITGNEQEQYMQVVLKSLEQYEPELVKATKHLTHGLVKLKGGVKMSSRKGNILRAVDVLDAAAEANQKATGKNNERVELGAIKYAFLKVRTGGDIIYDPEESVSLEGNSGPYLQYAYARANSILNKAENNAKELKEFVGGERELVAKLSEFGEVVAKATDELMPHQVCTYLYELAQVFNRFYEKNRVIGDERQAERLYLVQKYAATLKIGLALLGIEAPDHM